MTAQTPVKYELIKNHSELREIITVLQNEPVIGVDLEADSMFHYQEKICLLQIATHALNILIDPLSVEDLSPLAPIFADAGVRKVFHGADYDIRSLYRDVGIEVHSLFDTQIAAKFLGARETGLAVLLKKEFHVLSDKKYQKKDWSQRPLPSAMLQYAVQDICYLIPLADILERKLLKKRLLFCVEEECERLSRVRPDLSKNKSFFLSFKGAAKLGPRNLAILESILCFRDQVAKRRNLPCYKVMGNKSVLEIALKKPLARTDLAEINGLSPKLIDHMGKAIIKKVREGLSLPEKMLPVYPEKISQKLRPKEASRVKALKIWRERLGCKWNVEPSLVCTNAQIQEIAVANPEQPENMECFHNIRKWQIKLFGKDICNILQETN